MRYADAHGVALSGTIRITKFLPSVDFQGAVSVSGARASAGVLGLAGGSIRGTIGGKLFK